MRKYAQGEGNLEVLRGEEAVVVNEHLAKTGKAVTEFDDNERQALHADLDRVRGEEPSSDDSRDSSEDSAPESE